MHKRKSHNVREAAGGHAREQRRRADGSRRDAGPRRGAGGPHRSTDGPRRHARGPRRGDGATQARGRVNRREVADRLHSAAIHLLRTVRKTDISIGISPARLSALSVLVFGGPRSLRELAEAEQVTAPTTSRIAAGLESEGFLSRRADKHDRRAIQLRATAKGKAALERGRRLRIESLASLLRSASKDDLATLSQAARLIEAAVAAQERGSRRQ